MPAGQPIPEPRPTKNLYSIDMGIRGPYFEAPAYEVPTLGEIMPGMLLRWFGGAVHPHDQRDQQAPCVIATEDPYRGTGIDHPYGEGDLVHIRHCLPGDIFYGWLEANESASTDWYLSSAGNGYLKRMHDPPVVNDDKTIVGMTLEGHGLATYPRRIRVRVI